MIFKPTVQIYFQKSCAFIKTLFRLTTLDIFRNIQNINFTLQHYLKNTKKMQIMYLDVFFNSERNKHDENKSKPILGEGKIGLYHELLKINVFNKYDELTL